MNLISDLRFAGRRLFRRPALCLIVVLTLGFGIGGVTSVFALINAVLLQDLPFPDSDRLVSLWTVEFQADGSAGTAPGRVAYTYPDFLALRENADRLQGAAAFAGWSSAALTGEGNPEQVSVGLASEGLFELLGGTPALGRFLDDSADVAGGRARAPVAVLSFEFWQRRFGGAPEIIGRSIALDDVHHTVVGVLPDGLRLESEVLAQVVTGHPDDGLRDVWVPIGWNGGDPAEDGNAYEVIGRLATGATIAQVEAEAQSILESNLDNTAMEVRAALRKSVVTDEFRSPLWTVFASACVLLAVVGGNLAALLSSEALQRRDEVALRVALGAPARRIAQQLFAESALLGVAGAGLGLLIATAGTELLVTYSPPMPRLAGVRVDAVAVGFAVAAGLLTTVALGVVPTMALMRSSLSLNQHSAAGRAVVGDRRGQQHVLRLQIALTMSLLVAGGLLGRSLVNLRATETGFDTTNLATVRVAVPDTRYGSAAAAATFFDQVLEKVESLRGVSRATASYGLPFPGGAPQNALFAEARESWVPGRRRTVFWNYHETMRIPLIQGRLFTEGDGQGAAGAIIVSQSLARQHWPTETPVGAEVLFFGERYTIVGVVGDVRHSSLRNAGEATFYVPFAQVPRHNLTLVARTTVPASQVVGRLSDAVWAIDPDVPVMAPSTMGALISESLREARFQAFVIAVFGTIALFLAAVGILGSTARSVARRQREMAVRAALGSSQRGLVRAIVGASASLALSSVLLGGLAAYWATGPLSAKVYGVTRLDPLTYTVATALILAVVFLASYLPARRLVRLDPAEALRRD